MSEFDETDLPEEDLTGPDLEEEKRIGAQCAALRNSEAYQRVTQHMIGTTVEAFGKTPLRDTEGLLYCRMLLHVINSFDELLRDAIDTGTMSAEQLEKQRSTFKGEQENT